MMNYRQYRAINESLGFNLGLGSRTPLFTVGSKLAEMGIDPGDIENDGDDLMQPVDTGTPQLPAPKPGVGKKITIDDLDPSLRAMLGLSGGSDDNDATMDFDTNHEPDGDEDGSMPGDGDADDMGSMFGADMGDDDDVAPKDDFGGEDDEEEGEDDEEGEDADEGDDDDEEKTPGESKPLYSKKYMGKGCMKSDDKMEAWLVSLAEMARGDFQKTFSDGIDPKYMKKNPKK